MTSGEITAFVVAATPAILGYFKIQADRKQTGQERDMAHALLQQEVSALKETVRTHSDDIGILGKTCNEINLTLREVATEFRLLREARKATGGKEG